MTDPSPDQLKAAIHAGWDVGMPGEPDYPREPPGGWDAHALDPGPVAYVVGPADG